MKNSPVRYLVLLLVILAVVDVGLLVYSTFSSKYPACVPLGAPTAYRNIYIHVPIAWATYTLFTIAFVASILYLMKGSERLDAIAYYSVALGLVYALATLVTGSLWASESWGSPWNWDPRETSVLLLFLAYLVYPVLRQSISDPDRAKTVSAVYAVAAYATIPISYLAPIIVPSLHPTMRQFSGVFRDPLALATFASRVFIVTLVAITLLYGLVKRVSLGNIARYVAAIYLAAGLIILVYGLTPFTGKVLRVINATVVDNNLTLLLSDGSSVELPLASVPMPLRLSSACYSRGLCACHLVLVNGGMVSVVTHWSVVVNAAIYSISVALVILLLRRIVKR